MTRARSIFSAFITLVMLALMPSHASAAWSQCGSEGDSCRMSGPGHHLVRYGSNGSYFYIETDGNFTEVACNNGVFGDAAYGSAKICEYTALDPVDPKTRWLPCAGEDQTCAIADGLPHLVKYASDNDPGRAEYRIASTPIPCNNDYFTDVHVGVHKSCYYAAAIYGEIKIEGGAAPKRLEFTDCASEGQRCKLTPDVEAALVRYGEQGKWTYRLASTAQFTCSSDVLKYDPAYGDGKFCQYAYVPPRITGLTGTWTKVSSCSNCDNLVESVAIGIQGSRSNMTSSTWSNEVSIEVEKKWGAAGGPFGGGGGGGVKVSASTKWGGSESTGTTVSRSVTTTKKATCSAPNKRITMYQWSMDVSDECYALQGQCQSHVSSFDILCTADAVPTNFAPACQPGQPTTEDVANCIPLSTQ